MATAAEVQAGSASSVFYFLFLPAVVLAYIYWKVSRRHMLKLAEKLPGPPGLPIIGNAMEFRGSSHRKYFENQLKVGI